MCAKCQAPAAHQPATFQAELAGIFSSHAGMALLPPLYWTYWKRSQQQLQPAACLIKQAMPAFVNCRSWHVSNSVMVVLAGDAEVCEEVWDVPLPYTNCSLALVRAGAGMSRLQCLTLRTAISSAADSDSLFASADEQVCLAAIGHCDCDVSCSNKHLPRATAVPVITTSCI